MKGVLTVVSGFSGVGKGTVVSRMRDMHDFTFSISATTRAPRDNDVEGETYYFISREAFETRIQKGEFLEWARYAGEYYGTPKGPVLEALERGEDVILEIEVQGALQVKEQYPDALLIFVLPPSMAELKRRLVGRGTDSPEKIEQRLAQTLSEFPKINRYDCTVVNHSIASCAEEILTEIEAYRERTAWLTALEEEAHQVVGDENSDL